MFYILYLNCIINGSKFSPVCDQFLNFSVMHYRLFLYNCVENIVLGSVDDPFAQA